MTMTYYWNNDSDDCGFRILGNFRTSNCHGTQHKNHLRVAPFGSPYHYRRNWQSTKVALGKLGIWPKMCYWWVCLPINSWKSTAPNRFWYLGFKKLFYSKNIETNLHRFSRTMDFAYRPRTFSQFWCLFLYRQNYWCQDSLVDPKNLHILSKTLPAASLRCLRYSAPKMVRYG